MRSSMMQLLVLSLVLDETCARDKKGKNEQRPDKGKEAPQHLDNYEEKGRNNPKVCLADCLVIASTRGLHCTVVAGFAV